MMRLLLNITERFVLFLQVAAVCFDRAQTSMPNLITYDIQSYVQARGIFQVYIIFLPCIVETIPII